MASRPPRAAYPIPATATRTPKRRLGGDRRDYLRYLAQHRRGGRRYVEQQGDASRWRHPDRSPAAS
ncbi:hypothetical protein K1W54_07155 [Micromonospora sp. CPCC 205371]|nr:hypothetical protein [Micromonospora sp. CPCC 205371]